MTVAGLIVDNFAGGGGASTGIEMALGRAIDIAINHDPEAIQMHLANHPNTLHLCESVWDVDPISVAAGKVVDLAWFSPDCKHFSKAKGGKPVEKKIRGLAWVAIRWAATVRPLIIMLENVEEFTTWGPLGPDGKPCKKRKGQTFKSFVRHLERLGYKVEYRELKACDYGAPTIRKRLFLIAGRDGQPIVWPTPTHGAPNSKEVKEGKLLPWRTAAECIDWSIPCPSIFERKKPLADATLRRIARGIIKYVIEAKEPFVVTCNHQCTCKTPNCNCGLSDLSKPFKTITASRDAHGIVVPTLVHNSNGERPGQAPRVPGLEKPLGTIMAEGQKHALVGATLIQSGFGEAPGSPPRCIDIQKPLGTVCGSTVKHALAVATLLRHFGSNVAGNNIKEPIPTVMCDGAGGKLGVITAQLSEERLASIAKGKSTFVSAFLDKYNGNSAVQEVQEPLDTVTASDRFSLVTIDCIEYVITDIGMRMLEPHELFAAQGFPPDYVIAPTINGKKMSKTAQVRMVGNSVSPMVAEALVRANMVQEQLHIVAS